MTRETPSTVPAQVAGLTTIDTEQARASSSPVGELIRVIVADEYTLYRDGLRLLLSAQPDFHVVGEAADGTTVLSLVRDLQPDVLLLDAGVANPSAFEVLEALHTGYPMVQTIVLASILDRQSVVTAIRRGARGIFLKGAAADLLFKSIRLVHHGELWINHDAVAALAETVSGTRDALVRDTPMPLRDFGLTARERDVLRLIVEGETNKGIAAKLSVGPDTVKHHLTNIFNKTGASSRLELALFAIHHRLVQA